MNEKELEKFRSIYWENVYIEKDFMDNYISYIKAKGFKTTKEYEQYHEELQDKKFRQMMKELKRINNIYSKGGYLTIR